MFGKVEFEGIPVYPLFRNEKKEVQKFVNKHLKKGYIRPSKLFQTLPVFFVDKKDGGKTHGYCYRTADELDNPW